MYRTIRSCTITYRAIQIRASDVSHDRFTYKKLSHDTGNSIKLLSYVSHDTLTYKNLSHDTEAAPSAALPPVLYETLTQSAGSVSGVSPTTVSVTVQVPSSATLTSYVTVVSEGVVSQERANVKLTVAVPVPWVSKV